MKASIRRAAITGIATGVFGIVASILPPIDEAEETLGLRYLYAIRGPVEPPPEVLIVGVSDESFAALDLPLALDDSFELTAWPRAFYTEAIAKLKAWGVGPIAFDVHFRDAGTPSEDAELGDAIRSADSVILFAHFERVQHMPAPGMPGVVRYEDSLEPPLASFAAAASAVAPFPLPTEPNMTNWYWAFIPQLFDAPTLPSAVLAVMAGEPGRWLLDQLAPGTDGAAEDTAASRLSRRLVAARRELLRDPARAAALQDELERRARESAAAREPRLALALLGLLAGPEAPYLNFYGRPQTIRTIPIHEVLTRDAINEVDWANAAVFIGFSSRAQPLQADEFRTFYTLPSGLEISGVEIAATALANQIDGRHLRPQLMQQPFAYSLVFVIGLACGACFLAPTAKWAVAGLGLLFASYLMLAQLAFDVASMWLPMVTPNLLQAPLALSLGLSLLYRRARAQHAAVTRGASLFLPPDLLRRIEQDPAAVRAAELASGICMVTDIEQYTAYSESVPPAMLKARLDAYYESLFSIVTAHGGLVTDIVGDSMVAIWSGPAESCRRQALEAAAAIANRLGQSSAEFPKTRVGLQAGEFMLGAVGASERLEYRAVGDSVNSAARIQALNKLLGTTVLAAREALPAGAPRRDLGSFQLPGKSRLIEICEPRAGSADAARDALDAQFATALDAFRSGDSALALELFERLLDRFPTDGPARFYARYLREAPSSDDTRPDPVIRLHG